MANLIERNQQRKEKLVFIHVYFRDCPRAEECPHEFVEVSTRLRPSFRFCREFGLLHLSRTKNWKLKRGSQNRSFASGSLLTLSEDVRKSIEFTVFILAFGGPLWSERSKSPGILLISGFYRLPVTVQFE